MNQDVPEPSTKGSLEDGSSQDAKWACRAGTRTRFCSGNDEASLREYAWYWRGPNRGAAASPVSTRTPNAWGLHDCHGNVWEWCADWYSTGYYTNGPGRDPAGPATGSSRVLRGGSWFNEPGSARSACRGKNTPTAHSSDTGFRVVLTTVSVVVAHDKGDGSGAGKKAKDDGAGGQNGEGRGLK